MVVALPAAEAQDVEPLRGDHPDRVADKVDDPLEREVLVRRKVVDDVLPVLLRSDEHVAVERLEPLQEGDRVLVLVDDVARVRRIPGKELADEAAALQLPAHGLEVDPPSARRSHAPRWQTGHQ
jgi:hypothetical protein